MQLYHISDKYIEYLHEVEPAVFENKQGNRPYVGVALAIDGIEYYVPMCSPKPKHENMRDSLDFMKIANKKRMLGVLNLSCMIPVHSAVLELIDIGSEPDDKYRSLLHHEHQWVQKNAAKIKKNARKLYEILMRDETDGSLSGYERKLRERCCDLALLEKRMKEFEEAADASDE